MSFIEYNANPDKTRVGDCVVRAIAKATNQDWDSVLLGLTLESIMIHDMPSADFVWGSYLSKKGFKRYVITNGCLDCYTVEDFCRDHPEGTFVLGTGKHAIAVVDGDIYDTWNSSTELPIFYWQKEE